MPRPVQCSSGQMEPATATHDVYGFQVITTKFMCLCQLYSGRRCTGLARHGLGSLGTQFCAACLASCTRRPCSQCTSRTVPMNPNASGLTAASSPARKVSLSCMKAWHPASQGAEVSELEA